MIIPENNFYSQYENGEYIFPCDNIGKFYSKDCANDRLFYTVTHIFGENVYSLHGIFSSKDNALKAIQRERIQYPNDEFKVECDFVNKIR